MPLEEDEIHELNLFDYTTLLFFAVEIGCKNMVTELISKGAVVNAEDENGDSPLHLAVQRGFKSIVMDLLRNNADVNAQETFGETPLHYAAQSSCSNIRSLLCGYQGMLDPHGGLSRRSLKNDLTSILVALLDHGADMKIKNNQGQTALFVALACKHTSHASVLLDRGAELNVADYGGNAALHYAVEFKRFDVDFVTSLLNKGADVNSQNHQRQTALHIAAEYDYKPNICVLVDNGAEVNLKDRVGNTPLHCAVASKRFDADCVTSFLSRGADVNCPNNQGKTALHIAAEMGFLPNISVLVSYGADVNLRDHVGNTALHYAASIPSCEGTISLLLNSGADVNGKNFHGKTALHIAAQAGCGEWIPLMVERGAEINLQDNAGNTALHYAASLPHHHGDLVFVLLLLDADVNYKNHDGKTPLHLNVLGNQKWLRCLLDYGADASLKDYAGNTALHYSASNPEHHSEDLIALLARADVNSRDRNGRTALFSAGSASLLFNLLDYGAEINLQDNDGSTVLHCAAALSNDHVFSALLSLGLDLNAKNYDGKTALHVAAAFGKSDYVLYLCERKARMSLQDQRGNTPLHYAALAGSYATVSILISYGANVDCKGEFGKTALYLACERDCLRVVTTLLNYGADVNITSDLTPKLTPLQAAQAAQIDSINPSFGVVKCLRTQITRFHAIGLPLSEGNLNSIKLIYALDFTLALSLVRTVDGLSGRDMLKLKGNGLLVLIKNKAVREFFEKKEYRRCIEFSDMFEKQLRLANERVLLLKDTTFFLGKMFSIPPGICIDVITDNLSNRDLANFNSACEGTGC